MAHPLRTFQHLFLRRKFIFHRVFGLAYLLQYFWVIYLYATDYTAGFLDSVVIITLPLTGVIQCVTAIRYFWFMPKQQKEAGYFTDQGALSYPFIQETLFFNLLLAFQWLYYNPRLQAHMPALAELAFVFLPYTWRVLFPKTSFRDSLEHTLAQNHTWTRWYYYYGTHLTKLFYIWAKHYIGFFLNYLAFTRQVDEHTRCVVFGMLIASSCATTIAMFLHTLRYKGYLPGYATFGFYVVSYLATFYYYIQIFPLFGAFPALTLLTLGGLLLNLFSLPVWHLYQCGVAVLLWRARG